MIETATPSAIVTDRAARLRPTPAREENGAFSYTLAAAVLEKNAARALDAHGATPAGGDMTAQSADNSARTPPEASQPANGGKTAGRDTTRPSAEATPAARNATPDAISTQPIAAAFVTAVASAPATMPSAPATTAKATDVATLRANVAEEKAKAPQKALRTIPEPVALKSEFAEILAKRLEKSSVFDLRLDPPELGRVEGRLTVGDDGKAVLALSFDNQATFDLLSRDEQMLRQALVQAGLDFGAGDFSFSFHARPQDAPSANGAATSEPRGAYDPVFLADWSAGALDIRI